MAFNLDKYLLPQMEEMKRGRVVERERERGRIRHGITLVLAAIISALLGIVQQKYTCVRRYAICIRCVSD